MLDMLVILFTTGAVVTIVLRAIAADLTEPWFVPLRTPEKAKPTRPPFETFAPEP